VITLITGVPGTGKTAVAVSMILDYLKGARPVYQHGIRDLTLDVLPLICGDDSCEFCAGKTGQSMHDFKAWAPVNAVLVLDEIQRQFRVRGRAAPVPQFVADLETHRHLGIDIVCITQDPRLVDQNIRRLVTLHQHLEPSLVGSRKTTWMQCQDNPKGAKGGETVTFSPPKRAFGHYVSAELHTKIKKPIPKGFYVLAIGLVFGIFGGYFAIQKVRSGFIPEPVEAEQISGAEAVTAEPVELFADSVPEEPQARDLSLPFNTTPAVAGVLESAPAYAGMVRYRDYPRRAACVQSVSRCRCYTQQGTDYPTSLQQCEAFIEGRVSSFNPYQSPAPMSYSRAQPFEVPTGGNGG